MPGLRVFEVDHPATQEMKRHLILESEIPMPSGLTFVPVDFERESLHEKLQDAGFDFSSRGFVSWLGVVPYLTRAAAMETFRVIGCFAPGSEIVFDYALPPSLAGITERLAFGVLAKRVAAAGEPFQTYFEPSELQQELSLLNFKTFENLDPDEINARYFSGRSDGLKIYGSLARLMTARTHGAG
jgi:methyltransferase (TIGR00027 family)